MKSKKTKNYQIEGQYYEFNYKKLNVLCVERSRSFSQKKTSLEFLLQLEEELNCEATASTIKGWMYGNNSPATLEMVDKLAGVFDIDRMDLLTKTERTKGEAMNSKVVVSDDAKAVVNEIYGMFVDAIEEYRCSEGFTDKDWKKSHGSMRENQWTNGVYLDELDNCIRKSRVYISKDMITSLQDLEYNLFDIYTEYRFQENYSIYSEGYDDDEIGFIPTKYGQWRTPNKEDTPENRNKFLCEIVEEYYDTLEEILEDYLA